MDQKTQNVIEWYEGVSSTTGGNDLDIYDIYSPPKWRIGVLKFYMSGTIEESINDMLDNHYIDARNVINIAMTGCEVKIFYRYETYERIVRDEIT